MSSCIEGGKINPSAALPSFRPYYKDSRVLQDSADGADQTPVLPLCRRPSLCRVLGFTSVSRLGRDFLEPRFSRCRLCSVGIAWTLRNGDTRAHPILRIPLY